MKSDIARSLLGYRGHKLAANEPLLILLKVMDEEIIKTLPQDRDRVKRILIEHGCRINNDDPLFLLLDLVQIQYLSMVDGIRLRRRQETRRTWPLAAAMSAGAGFVGLIAGIWLSHGRVDLSYVGVAATSMALAGIGAACGLLVWRRGLSDGA
ncbi:hypothetical protein [Ralstonia pseudosolanacearum]|uniref:hypothetical protein n=1 Tax=Ralstonia pseudosolanacearum TaxID=1310165 RepID=UPI0033935A20